MRLQDTCGSISYTIISMRFWQSHAFEHPIKKNNITFGVRLVYFWSVKKIRIVVFVLKFMLHWIQKNHHRQDALPRTGNGKRSPKETQGSVKMEMKDKTGHDDRSRDGLKTNQH